MPLRGPLSEFTLEDVLRFLQATGKTGGLEVRGPRGRGALELTAGQLSAAHCGDDGGVTALGAVLSIGVGDFVFRPGDAGTPNLEGPLDDLLGIARGEAQRIAATRALIRDGSARFAMSARAAARDTFNVTGAQWRVLLAVDGRRDVNEIAQVAGGGHLATLLTIGELVQIGLVDAVDDLAEALVEPAPAPVEGVRQPLAPPPPAEPIPSEGPSSEPPFQVEEPQRDAEPDARLAALAAIPKESAQAERPADATGTQGLRGVLTALTKAVVRTREPQEQVSATAAVTVPTSSTPTVTTADLARLANALIAEYSSGQYGVWPHEEIAARLRRVYQLNPVGIPLPLSGGELDVRALEDPQLEAGLVLPYIAMLIRQLREDGSRSFGAENADRGFRAAVSQVRGWDEALASAPDDVLTRSRAPTHGRLTLITAGERKTWMLGRRDYVIGRGSFGCDVHLDDQTVADHHAHLSPYLDGFQLRDLGSSSGTSVDGTPLTPIQGEHLLFGGETIRVGDVSLLYERLPDSDSANPSPA